MMNENDFGEYMLHMRKRERLETLAAGVQNLKGPMECTVIIRSGLPFEDIASDVRGTTNTWHVSRSHTSISR
jgi:hypothetical protein